MTSDDITPGAVRHIMTGRVNGVLTPRYCGAHGYYCPAVTSCQKCVPHAAKCGCGQQHCPAEAGE